MISILDSTFDIYKLDYYRSVASKLKNIIQYFFTIKFITLLTFYITSKLLNSFDLSKLLQNSSNSPDFLKLINFDLLSCFIQLYLVPY